MQSTRRRASGRLDAATLAALRELLTPPAESEADAARFVAGIMARLPAVSALLVLVLLGACGGGAERGGAGETSAASTTATASTASPTTSPSLDAADVDVYERGLQHEIALVRAAQERASAAATPQARAEATQAQWEDQTVPAAARAIGVDPERYKQVRETLHTVMQTLDFQGKIDGPMELDTARATPEMRARLTRDPIAELPAPVAAALRARLDRLAPIFARYVTLTAVGG